MLQSFGTVRPITAVLDLRAASDPLRLCEIINYSD